MTKEHLIERYGTLRYTIGTGCSGGSLAMQWIANAYPGVYQGILPTLLVPGRVEHRDAVPRLPPDARLLRRPRRSGARGSTWTPTSRWPTSRATSRSPTRRSATRRSSTSSSRPTRARGITDQERYHPTTNPGGVRCTIQDAAINVFGPRPRASGRPQEQAARARASRASRPTTSACSTAWARCAAARSRPPSSSTSTRRSAASTSTPSPSPNRIAADRPALANAYRSGMINETNNLDRDRDHRLPRTRRRRLPRRVPRVRRAGAARPRARRPRQPADLGGPDGHPRRPAVRAEQLRRDGPLARRGREGRRPSGRSRGRSSRNKPGGPHRPLLRRHRRRRSRTTSAPSVVTHLRHAAHGRRRRDHDRHQQVPAQAARPHATTAPCRSRTPSGPQLRRIFPDGVCDFSKPGVDQQRDDPVADLPGRSRQGHLRRPADGIAAEEHSDQGEPPAAGGARRPRLVRLLRRSAGAVARALSTTGRGRTRRRRSSRPKR